MTAKKVDGNQAIIVSALRAADCHVEILSDVGHGFPDLLVCFRDEMTWHTCLMEVKSPGGKLTPDELIFWLSWPGLKFIVRSPEDALRQIGKAK
jgi:hypothetical protein